MKGPAEMPLEPPTVLRIDLPRIARPAAAEMSRANPAQPTRFILATLIACLLLQRFAVPLGADMKIPVATPIVLGVALFEIMAGRLALDGRRVALFLSLATAAMATTALQAAGVYATNVSFSSLSYGLLITSFSTLTFSKPVPETEFFRMFRPFFAIVAIAGLVQFILQFAGVLTFQFSTFIPPQFLLEDGFATFQTLHYGSDIYRSNGFFLLEPSLLGQFIAVAIIMEVLCSQRPLWLLLYGAALVVSVSGTGMLVLAAFGLPLVLVSGPRGIARAVVMAIAGGVVLLIVSITMPQITETVFDRSREFSEPGSSGNARFIGAFAILQDILTAAPWAALTGVGPGTAEHLDVSYEYLPNTISKYMVEYGLIGLALYLALILSAERSTRQQALLLPALVLILFNGQYQQFSPVVFPIFLIIIVARLEDATASTEPDAPTRQR
jgi:hypothetical protein